MILQYFLTSPCTFSCSLRSLFFVPPDHSQPPPALMTTAHRSADLGEIATLPHTDVLVQAEGAIACSRV
ncbi:hypothetical protein [Crocosphaera sp. Alani8]|uniref:hypothetical protein n=1 Tax=Crocosphaera sp. Alani8 TaxID=3038952 RepID=UPI00313E5A25